MVLTIRGSLLMGKTAPDRKMNSPLAISQVHAVHVDQVAKSLGRAA
jgi:hypothetical protein